MLRAGAIALVLARAAVAAPADSYGNQYGYNGYGNNYGARMTTSTTCLGTTAPAFTSTVGNTVIIGKTATYSTITSACSADQMPYSTTMATANCVTPGVIKVVTPIPYITSEKWCASDYTSTAKGTVTVCHKQSTRTVTFSVPANSPAYTSTVAAVDSTPGTVIYGTPSAYVTTDAWCSKDSTATNGATITVCHKQSTNTITQTIPADQPLYTSTVPAVDSTPGTVIVATRAPYSSVHKWCAGDSTVTNGPTVTICHKQSTKTMTTTIPAGNAAYTSTVEAVGGTPGTVIYATPSDFVTKHVWCADTTTVTNGGTVSVCHKQSTTTMTTTVPATVAAYTSTVQAVGSTPGTVIIATPSFVSSVSEPVATGESGGTPQTGTSGSCGNGGMDYAIYNNPFKGGSSSVDPYLVFDPSYFQRAQVVATGVTQTLGYSNTGSGSSGSSDSSSSGYSSGSSSSGSKNYGTVSIYNSATSLNAQYFTVAHRAYLFAAEAGKYTFTMRNTDDFVGLWTGTFAIRDYTRANVRECQVFADHANKGVKTYTVKLRQGQYIPFRIMYANGGGPANFDFSITSPSGKVLTDAKEDCAPYIVRSSCDGSSLTPAFKAWSAEIY